MLCVGGPKNLWRFESSEPCPPGYRHANFPADRMRDTMHLLAHVSLTDYQAYRIALPYYIRGDVAEPKPTPPGALVDESLSRWDDIV